MKQNSVAKVERTSDSVERMMHVNEKLKQELLEVIHKMDS